MSPDPELVEKIRDLVGLYMNPPVAAAVFAIDEKPQIQALNRTAPTLPMLPTTPARATHDYQRNGTCDLFAALEIATGKVITDIRPRHTSTDFVAFLNKVNREVPADLDVHVILDNLATHKTPTVHKLAAAPPPLPLPLHPHLRVVDEPRRTMVLRADHQEAATLRPPQRQRARRRHPSLGRHTGTRTPPRSSGTRPPRRSSNASPATAPPSTKEPTHDPTNFTALQPSGTLVGRVDRSGSSEARGCSRECSSSVFECGASRWKCSWMPWTRRMRCLSCGAKRKLP